MSFIPISLLAFVSNVGSKHVAIEKSITDYFDSDAVKSFYDTWSKHKVMLETDMNAAFESTLNKSKVNVYMGKKEEHYNLADGFHITDGVGHLLLLNLDVKQKPFFHRHAITLELSNNVVRVDVELSPIYMVADYLLLRNSSGMKNAPHLELWSPFYSKDLKPHGSIDIMAADCRLVGIAVASLFGSSLHVGHAAFRISDCTFTFNSASLGTFLQNDMSLLLQRYGLILESLLSRYIVDELRLSLQGALYSAVNTTEILGIKLSDFRKVQRKIFAETNAFVRKLVNVLNILAMAENGGTFKVKERMIIWNDISFLRNVSDPKFGAKNVSTDTALLITDLIVSGLDTAYSAHTGGPYNYMYPKIMEDVRFHNLHVQGKIYCANETTKGFRKFFIEIKDFTVTVKINLKFLQENKEKKYKKPHNVFTIDYLGWREVDYNNLKKIVSKSFVIAYLIHELPLYILKYLQEVLPRATEIANSDIDEDLLTYNSIKARNESKLNDNMDRIVTMKSKNIDKHINRGIMELKMNEV